MKYKTILHILLLFLFYNIVSCAIIAEHKTPETVEDAVKQREVLKKKRIRQARRANKKHIKEYWASQTPEVRKSIKRNSKKQKKLLKQRRKINKQNEKKRKEYAD